MSLLLRLPSCLRFSSMSPALMLESSIEPASKSSHRSGSTPTAHTCCIPVPNTVPPPRPCHGVAGLVPSPRPPPLNHRSRIIQPVQPHGSMTPILASQQGSPDMTPHSGRLSPRTREPILGRCERIIYPPSSPKLDSHRLPIRG